jgi:hypothetical protein
MGERIRGWQIKREKLFCLAHTGTVEHGAQQAIGALGRIGAESVGGRLRHARPRHARHRAMMLAIAATAGWEIRFAGAKSRWSYVAPERHQQYEMG